MDAKTAYWIIFCLNKKIINSQLCDNGHPKNISFVINVKNKKYIKKIVT